MNSSAGSQNERLICGPWATPSTQDVLREAVKRELITEVHEHRASAVSQKEPAPIQSILLELGFIDEASIYQILSDLSGLPLVQIGTYSTSNEIWSKEELALFRREGVAPIAVDEENPVFAISRFEAMVFLEAMAFKLRKKIKAALAPPGVLVGHLDRITQQRSEEKDLSEDSDVSRLRKAANNGPVVTAVNDLIGRAVALGASDIHLEAHENGCSIRFRVNGEMQSEGRLEHTMIGATISRLKIMADLNISEKRRPQDGRCSVVVRGRPIDIRLSTLPVLHGESVVLRLLDQRAVNLTWQDLGYSETRKDEIRQLISKPDGLILIAGPTGSGKTTTLYTSLSELNQTDRKIITVEDPVEYQLEGVVQVQVETEVDMTFAKALRAVLRQDPNIVMIGEIRDAETAEIALRAAQMGRLVLSTIHTNDAISAIDRLLDLGLPPFLLASSLRAVLGQRLVRKTCVTCQANGCKECNNTGRSGRTVISELFEPNAKILEAIAAGKTSTTLKNLLQQQGHRDLSCEANDLIAQGIIQEADWRKAYGH